MFVLLFRLPLAHVCKPLYILVTFRVTGVNCILLYTNALSTVCISKQSIVCMLNPFNPTGVKWLHFKVFRAIGLYIGLTHTF